MKKSSAISTLFITTLFASSLQAATVVVAVAGGNNGSTNSTSVNLTTDGNLDWGTWQNSSASATTGRTITNRMSSGAGFTSLNRLGSANDTASLFTVSQYGYNWTNGTPAVTGANVTRAARVSTGSLGAGLELKFNVTTAGSYQLKFYSATSGGVTYNGIAALTTGAVSDSALRASTSNTGRLDYTVDFTTDGADTLTLSITQASGTANIFAFEAFSLASVPEPSSALLFGLAGCAFLVRRRK
jgi:hypothetical protein